MQAGEETSTQDETKAIAAYYKMLNNMISIFDLEKPYIPRQLDETKDLYGNQLIIEKATYAELNLMYLAKTHLHNIGCSSGRIAHHFASLSGGQVSGYSIDPNQIEKAIDWAPECDMSHRLHFQADNHHESLQYESERFDGCFSFQAI